MSNWLPATCSWNFIEIFGWLLATCGWHDCEISGWLPATGSWHDHANDIRDAGPKALAIFDYNSEM